MYDSLRSILELLKAEKVSIDEAIELIEALYEAEKNEEIKEKSKDEAGKKKFLRIIVDSQDGDKVRVNIPIALVKYAKTFVPKNVKSELNSQNVDLDGIIKMVEEGFEGEILTVDSEDGDHVKIFVE
ncbi:MAG: hypothetical protein J7K69_04855 [Thermotogae bacterium]|nr:hypothetical protein [Thermotogota bacterium]